MVMYSKNHIITYKNQEYLNILAQRQGCFQELEGIVS